MRESSDPSAGKGVAGADPASWAEGRAALQAAPHCILAAACALTFWLGGAPGWLVLAVVCLQGGMVMLVLGGLRWAWPGTVLAASPAVAWFAMPWPGSGDPRLLPWALTLLAAAAALAVVVRGRGFRMFAAAVGGALGLLALSGLDAQEGMQLALPVRFGLAALSLSLLAWPGEAADQVRVARRFAMAVIGASILVMTAWTSGSAGVLQSYPAGEPIQPITALLLLVSGIALVQALHLKARSAIGLALLTCGVVVTVWLLELAGQPPPLAVRLEGGGLPRIGRLATNVGFALLVCQLGVIGLALRARRSVLPIVSWVAGLLVGAIAVLGLAGHWLAMPELQGWGGEQRMALPTASILLPLGVALVLGGLGLQRDARIVDAVLPVLAGAVSLLVGLQLWHVVASRDREVADLAVDLQMEAFRTAFQTGAGERLGALERFAGRLDAFGEADARQRLFEADAGLYLRDFGSLRAIALVDERRRVQAVASADERYHRQQGRADDVEPLRREVYDRVDAGGGAHLSAPFALAEGGYGQLFVQPVAGGGYVVASIGFQVLFRDLLGPIDPGAALRVHAGDAELYRRGFPTGPPARSAGLSLYGQDWRIELWPEAHQRTGRLPLLMLSFALVISGLLAFLLRLAFLARRRFERAEAASHDLAQQVRERERAEVALNEREDESRSLLEGLVDGFLVLDRGYRVHYLNPEAARRLHRPRAEVEGRPLSGVLRPDEFSEVRACCDRVLDQGVVQAVEMYFTSLQGWCELRAHPHPRGVAVYLRNIEERKRTELALRRSQSELEAALAGRQMMMDSSLDVIYTLDAGGGFTQVSAACRRLWGYSPEELSRAKFIEMVHPDDVEATRAMLERVLAGHSTTGFVNRFLHRDGSVVHNQWSAVWSERHQLMFCVARDISAALQAESDLRVARQHVLDARESLLRAQRIANIGSWELDPATGDLRLSAQGHAILGVDAGAFRDRLEPAIEQYVHPEDAGRVRAALEALVATGELMDIEHRILRPDGSVRHVHQIAQRVDTEGGPLVTGTMQDITERTHTEAALAQAMRERESALEGFRRIMQHSLDVICCFDREGRFLQVSDAAREIWGFEPEALVGEKLDLLVHPEDLAQTYAAVAGVVGGTPRYDFRNRNLARDGSLHYMRWSAIWSESEQTLYAVGHDDTAQHEEQDYGRRQQAILHGIASRVPLSRTLAELAELNDRVQPDALTSILLLDAEGRCLRHAAAPKLPDAYNDAIDGVAIGPEVGSCGTAAWRREPVVVEDIRSDPLWTRFRDLAEAHGLRACWSLPVLDVDGGVLGTFAVYYRQPRAPQAQELERIRGLSSLAAIAIAQHRAYARIRDSEQRFRSLFDNHPDAICALDASGRYLEANSRYLRLAELEEQALVGRHYREVEAAGSLAEIESAVESALRGEVVRYEVARERPDGGAVHLSCLNVPIALQDGVHGLFMLLQDVTDLRRAQASLRQRDLFFDMSMELFAISDPAERRFLQVNPAFARILGFRMEEVAGRAWDEFIVEDPRSSVLPAAPEKAVPGDTIRRFRNRYRTADGGSRWLEWIGQIGEDGLAYAAARDITEQMAAEEALQQVLDDLRARNRELKDFAFVASHDLQEPLRKIRTYADRFTQRYAERLDPQGQDYLTRMNQAAARMQRLIDDLLAYSRIGSRQGELAQVDLGQVVAEVVSDLESRIEGAGARLEVDALPVLRADETQMRQLFQNLLANALKFSAPGRAPVIAIRVESGQEAGARGWRFRVSDNGVGFSPHHAERIFAPFQRLHGRSEYEGTGIGLAIVRRIVERHGGWIRAEGKEGEGACFEFFLPEATPRRSLPASPEVAPS